METESKVPKNKIKITNQKNSVWWLTSGVVSEHLNYLNFSTTKSKITERIFKLTQIHALMILKILWIQWKIVSTSGKLRYCVIKILCVNLSHQSEMWKGMYNSCKILFEHSGCLDEPQCTMSICIKYLDENNNILGVDTSELTIGDVQNLGNSSSNWAVQTTRTMSGPLPHMGMHSKILQDFTGNSQDFA